MSFLKRNKLKKKENSSKNFNSVDFVSPYRRLNR